MTRSKTRAQNSPEVHALNLFCDDDNGSAFTALVHGYRFHIICDPKRLQSQSEKGRSIERQYSKLISSYRDAVEKEEDPNKYQERKDLEAAELHNPDEDQSQSQDSGVGSLDTASPTPDDNDSALGLEEDGQKHELKEIGIKDSGVVLDEQHDELDRALQNWMLKPFSQIFADLTPSEDKEEQSIHDWYTGPTYYYQLEIKDDELQAVELKSEKELEKRIQDLVPHIPIPRYIRDLNIKWIKAEDALVVSESGEPEPYHPCRVKVDDQTHFFKVVDTTQPQPTKRELKIMCDIEKKELHKKIRVPLVTGLIGYQDSKTEIMGFLMTDIEDPTPLTKMLDSDVIEDKREKWAREAERMVKILHDNNFVWGDAKADNFMVDKHGDLWIIDFGGSYTDGWVDPELNETVEGDNMGTEKIVNALKDPESNTYQPGEDGNGEEPHAPVSSSKKRARSEESDAQQHGKRKKSS